MALKKFGDFKGRSRRKEYWMFQLFSFILTLIPYALLFSGIESLSLVGLALIGIISLGLIIPSLAVLARRLHDTNRSAWWILIGIIPLIGSIVLLVFLCQESHPGTNAWGPNPKGIGGDQQDMEGVLDGDF